MRRDPLFYKIFQQAPELLFDLIDDRPANANQYRFDSVAVKEPKFEIDGVFLPPESDEPGCVYFCEIQFQKDPALYERLFSESLLYFYRNAALYSDWKAVVIYPSRSLEQTKIYPHRSLLNGPQVHRIYLDELGDGQDLPILLPQHFVTGLAAIVLTIADEDKAPRAARDILARADAPEIDQQRIIDLVTSIMVYKFTNLSRAEVKAMLGLDLTQEPRAIREAKEEGREEGLEVGLLLAQRSMIQRQLAQKFTPFPDPLRKAIGLLSSPQLEDLSLKLLAFDRIETLNQWLIESLGRQLAQTLSADRQTTLTTLSLEELITLAQGN
jgi:predicted transposase/invertase (TIGR01784 family)